MWVWWTAAAITTQIRGAARGYVRVRCCDVSEPEFGYSDLLPLGEDDTPYRLVTAEGVSTFEADGRTFLKVEPEALRTLAAEAMHDISHYLRPAHLAQLRRILDDPEARANDRFVALDLLKNANIAAGGVLPMCQDTGTAIVMGKRGQSVLTDGRRRGGPRRAASTTPTPSSTCATRRWPR